MGMTWIKIQTISSYENVPTSGENIRFSLGYWSCYSYAEEKILFVIVEIRISQTSSESLRSHTI